MKNPNGYGSVVKLSGKRRKPFAVRICTGWRLNEESGTATAIRKYVGYYATRKEAMMALAEYNTNPYEVDTKKITVGDLYERWSAVKFNTISDSMIRQYRSAYTVCDPIVTMKVNDLKLATLQDIFDKSDKNAPTLKKTKLLLGQMMDYGVKYEIVDSSKKDIISYIEIHADNPDKRTHTKFTHEEIAVLWGRGDMYSEIALILIYTGLRIGELLNLKKEDVDMDNRCFNVIASKTEAGIRQVPIADKIYPIFERFMTKGDKYLISSTRGKKYTYPNFLELIWNRSGTGHTPHDTRHTCITLLSEAEVDERVIRSIVGHKGKGVTETVYTHIGLDKKLDAINKI